MPLQAEPGWRQKQRLLQRLATLEEECLHTDQRFRPQPSWLAVRFRVPHPCRRQRVLFLAVNHQLGSVRTVPSGIHFGHNGAYRAQHYADHIVVLVEGLEDACAGAAHSRRPPQPDLGPAGGAEALVQDDQRPARLRDTCGNQ